MGKVLDIGVDPVRVALDRIDVSIGDLPLADPPVPAIQMLVRQREPGQYLLGSQGLYSVLSPFNVTDVGRPEHASIGREQRRTQPGNRRKRLRPAESISAWWQKSRVRKAIGQKSQNSDVFRERFAIDHQNRDLPFGIYRQILRRFLRSEEHTSELQSLMRY